MANCNPPSSTNSNYIIKEKIILLYRQWGWCHHKFPEVSLHPSVLLNDITIIPSLNIQQFTQQFRIADRDDFIIDGFLSLSSIQIYRNYYVETPQNPRLLAPIAGHRVYQRNCGINDIQNQSLYCLMQGTALLLPPHGALLSPNAHPGKQSHAGATDAQLNFPMTACPHHLPHKLNFIMM